MTASLRALVATAVLFSASTLAAQAAPSPAPASAPAPGSAAASTPAAAPAYRATHAEAMAIGRAVARHAFGGFVDSLIATADPANRTRENLQTMLTDAVGQVAAQLGAETRLVSERVMNVGGRIEYQRTAEFANVPVPLVFRVIMGAQGKWRGFTASTEDSVPAGEEVQP